MQGVIDENTVITEILTPVKKESWLIGDGLGFCLDQVENISFKLVKDEDWEIEEGEEYQWYKHILLHFRNQRTLEVRIGIVDEAKKLTDEETPYWFYYDDTNCHTTGYFDIETIEKLKKFVKYSQ